MAVVGCGYIGHRHIAMIDANPEMKLVAVADIRPAEKCDAPSGVQFYSNIDDLLASEGKLDVVSVCTPNGHHAEMAIKILKSGANVLMEKPLALSRAESDLIAAAEKESEGRVFCVFQNRYTPTSEWLKGIVGDGTLGELTSVIVEQIDATSNNGRTAHDYAVPYMWGTCGILYNKTYVPQRDAETWGSLWNRLYQGKLLMKDSYRDSYGTALIYAHRKDLALGKVTVPQLMNDYSPEAIATVEQYLKTLKPNIAGWEADFGKETMTKGKALLNMTWSGDAVWAIEEAEKVGVSLGYEVPREGSNVWFDGWVIPRYSRNPHAASLFINYLCQEDVAIANMETTGYVSSIAGERVLDEMSDEEAYPDSLNLSYFFGPIGRAAHLDPIMYPDSAVVARCAMIHDAGEHTPEVLDMWSKVKGDNLGGGIVIFLLAVVAALTAFVVYRKYMLYKHRRLSRVQRRHHVIRLK